MINGNLDPICMSASCERKMANERRTDTQRAAEAYL
jgi:hypothetical protein